METVTKQWKASESKAEARFCKIKLSDLCRVSINLPDNHLTSSTIQVRPSSQALYR